MAQLTAIDYLFRRLGLMRVIQRVGVTTDTIGFISVKTFRLLGSRMDALLIKVGNRFVAEQFTCGWVFLCMALLITSDTNLYRPMGQFLDVIMAVPAWDIAMNRLGKLLWRCPSSSRCWLP